MGELSSRIQSVSLEPSVTSLMKQGISMTIHRGYAAALVLSTLTQMQQSDEVLSLTCLVNVQVIKYSVIYTNKILFFEKCETIICVFVNSHNIHKSRRRLGCILI